MVFIASILITRLSLLFNHANVTQSLPQKYMSSSEGELTLNDANLVHNFAIRNFTRQQRMFRLKALVPREFQSPDCQRLACLSVESEWH